MPSPCRDVDLLEEESRAEVLFAHADDNEGGKLPRRNAAGPRDEDRCKTKMRLPYQGILV